MSTLKEICIPDIGGATDVDVIEVLVKPGDQIEIEDALITLEGDKATMEVPSPYAGKVKSLAVKVGDKVAEGDRVLSIILASSDADELAEPAAVEAEKKFAAEHVPTAQAREELTALPVSESAVVEPVAAGEAVHASPGVRRLAREFGVDLTQLSGSGLKGRIVKEDVQRYVKSRLHGPVVAGAGGLAIAPAPVVDFAKYGEIDTRPLNKIKRLTGINVHRSWVTVPHVTQFGEADITELEAFRKQQKTTAEKRGVRLTPLAFIMKAVVSSLKQFPLFNSSLDEHGQNLVFKHYYHIGVAVDTPNGLVVPVIRDVDKKGVYQLAEELAVVSAKARDKGLSVNDMSGSTFTISSLGGIGGIAFTPIVKAPDVAILGLSRTAMKPVWQNSEFIPRLMLPLSLSYDHRVIDGADGARFIVDLANRLADIRITLL